MKRINKLIVLGMMCIGALSVYASPLELTYDGEIHLYDLAPITLSLNGEPIETPHMPPVQIQQRTLVPIREILEPVGAFIEWKPDEQKAYINYGYKMLILEIDNQEVWVNGETVYLDVPAKMINNKVMVPVRFISEQIGLRVDWNQETRNINIVLPEIEEVPDLPAISEIPNTSEGAEDLKPDEGLEVPEVAYFEHLTYSYESSYLMMDIPRGLQQHQINIVDNYREKQIIIDLGEDYGEYLSDGLLSVGDAMVNSIQVITEETTKVIINEAVINTYDILLGDGQIIFDLMRPKEKYNKIVVIDAGHGGDVPGAVGNGIEEKDINLQQMNVLKDLLEGNTEIKVYYTREEDVDVPFEDRVGLGNEIEADLFVSLHNNSYNEQTSGTEVLYYPEPVSEEIATIMQKVLISQTGMRDRGIKPSPDIYVLNSSKMPSILLEGGFISNPVEAQLLQSESFTQVYALAVYQGILEIFDTVLANIK